MSGCNKLISMRRSSLHTSCKVICACNICREAGAKLFACMPSWICISYCNDQTVQIKGWRIFKFKLYVPPSMRFIKPQNNCRLSFCTYVYLFTLSQVKTEMQIFLQLFYVKIRHWYNNSGCNQYKSRILVGKRYL